MRSKNLLFAVFCTLFFSSCNHDISKVLEQIENMPAPDYSYIVQPVYKIDRETLEYKTKELYLSEEVKVGAVGIHGYDSETKEQKNDKYWLKVVLLNSKAIVDFKDELKMNMLGREIAKSTMSDISNADQYDKIQVTFVEVWNDGVQKQMKQNIFYSLPDLEITQL